jgi:hypothetical protein
MTMMPKPGSVALQFTRVCPDYVPSGNNYRVIVSALSFYCLSAAQRRGSIDEQVAEMIDLGMWSVPNLVAIYNALTAKGLLDSRGGYRSKAREGEAVAKYLRAVVDAAVLAVVETLHLDGVRRRRGFIAC